MSSGTTPSALPFSDEVEVSGHIIDSLILPKILDCITSAGGSPACTALSFRLSCQTS